MKHIILAIVLLFPCILIFNEGDNFMVNLAGFLYLFLVYRFGKTKYGSRFFKKVEMENDRMFNNLK